MKQSRWIVCAVAVLIVGFAGLELLAQAADPLVGTWELNAAKSKFMSATPVRSSVRTFVQDGDGYKYTNRGTDANGKATLVQYTAHYDGKDYPVTGSLESDAIVLKRIDRFTSESIQKKDGKEVVHNRRVVSGDGKSYTQTSRSINEKGETVTNIMVFDKK
jgi:hypothetical protein